MSSSEQKRKSDRAYYEANKERILEQKRKYREEHRVEINTKLKLSDEETKEKYRATRREWAANNTDKISARNKAYAEKNKEKLKLKWATNNAITSAKRKEVNAEGLKAIAKKYAPKLTKAVRDIYITRTEMAKDLGVKASYIEGISRKESYRMPKHKETNGIIYLYDRKEVAEWYLFAREVLAFHKIGEKMPRKKDLYTYKEGSLGHGVIMFARNNKELHLRNLEIRRAGTLSKW